MLSTLKLNNKNEQVKDLLELGKNFKLVLKLTKQQNKWLVDGAGIVNIPLDKRASR